MIEFIPVMLFILGWHPDKPGELDLQRVEMLFPNTEACADAGTKMAERMTQAAAEQSGARYEFRCMDIPARGEFDAAFRELGKQAQ